MDSEPVERFLTLRRQRASSGTNESLLGNLPPRTVAAEGVTGEHSTFAVRRQAQCDTALDRVSLLPLIKPSLLSRHGICGTFLPARAN